MKNTVIKRWVTLVLAACLIVSALAGVFVRAEGEVLAQPVFSHEGGIYKDSFLLTINAEAGDVYYTLDGSLPDKTSALYTGPVEIKSKNVSPRTIQGKVAQERYEKGVVVRAIAISGDSKSEVVTNTYFVSEKIASLNKNVPVVSLTAAPYDFWDAREGIYTNYDYEHNIGAYVEFFDNNGDGFERGIEMKVSGHGSRSNPKKSLRLYFTKGDVSAGKYMEYNIIEETDKNFYNTDDVKKYAKVTFRISDWSATDIKDPIAQRITSYMRPDHANSNPAAVFLNGEFWGIYECREQYDDRYIDYHYEDIDKDDVVFLDRDWTTPNEEYVLSDNGHKGIDRILYEAGPDEDQGYYFDQWNYVKYLMENCENDEMYKQLEGYVDIDNYIDYLFVYLYCDNIDWPGNNYKFWRTTMERSNGDVYGADGRWRFMVHDFDLAFDGVNNNTFEYAIKSNQPNDNARQPKFAAETINGLFKNEKFRNLFAQRAAAYLNTAVSVENITKITDDMVAQRAAVKGADLLRWNNQSGTTAQRVDAWKLSAVNKFVGFATNRNPYFEKTLIDFYNKYYNSFIAETTNFEFEIDSDKASANISGAVIRKSLYGDMAGKFTTTQYTNVPVEITAECNDGYYVKSITVNGEKHSGAKVSITPVQGTDYKVQFEIAAGEELGRSVSDIMILREDRFEKMNVGEKLPVDIVAVYSDGCERVFGYKVETDKDIVEISDTGIVVAKSMGEAIVKVTYKGITKEFNIIIK